MRELTKVFSDLLRDKRVRNEQNKFEAFSRQVGTVLAKYRKIYSAYCDLQAGLARAKEFYDDMRETIDSLKNNVDSFVENRRSEGAQLLGVIEASKGAGVGADKEQARLKDLMARMSVVSPVQSSQSPASSGGSYTNHRPPPLAPTTNYSPQQQSAYNPARSSVQIPPLNNAPIQQFASYAQPPHSAGLPPFGGGSGDNNINNRQQPSTYNPSTYGAISPPAHQQYFSPPPNHQYNQSSTPFGQMPIQHSQQMPAGWQPPPPPPGPPPNQDFNTVMSSMQGNYPSGAGGYAHNDPRRAPPPGQADPWAGLSSWK